MFSSVKELINEPYSQKWKKLSFGSTELDLCTNGGITIRGITEICGEAGAGKSQILMQLALIAQLPCNLGGLNKKVGIVFTEGKFPSHRLLQIAKTLSKKYSIPVEKFLNDIIVQHIMHSDKLIETLSKNVPEEIVNNDVGLLIIDSIGALFRSVTADMARSNNLKLIGKLLLNIVEKYNCAVICANQVSSYNNTMIPALGLTWSNQIRTRFMVEKNENESQIVPLLNKRKFKVLFSPEISDQNCCEFLITNDGIS